MLPICQAAIDELSANAMLLAQAHSIVIDIEY
jgi:hypothetical protein